MIPPFALFDRYINYKTPMNIRTQRVRSLGEFFSLFINSAKECSYCTYLQIGCTIGA